MDISEEAFEAHITEYLSDVHGYRLRESQVHYDKVMCFDWELLLEFITASQPDIWLDLKKQHGILVKDKFVRRLTKEIERRGTLDVFRRGIKDSGCYFQLVHLGESIRQEFTRPTGDR